MESEERGVQKISEAWYYKYTSEYPQNRIKDSKFNASLSKLQELVCFIFFSK